VNRSLQSGSYVYPVVPVSVPSPMNCAATPTGRLNPRPRAALSFDETIKSNRPARQIQCYDFIATRRLSHGPSHVGLFRLASNTIATR
jgi:hypothetical protein